MVDFSDALRRAAQRVPGPVAERSLAQVATLRRWVPLDMAISDPDPTIGLLRIGRAEAWCLRCGETLNENGFCVRCGARRSRMASDVLRPDEYYVAT